MAQSVYLMGATYQDVPSVVLPTDNQGGTASFYDARTVTYNLSGGATVSANPTNAIAGQGFSVKLKAPAGYNLNGVTVMMGGVDITSQVFEYDEGGGSSPTLQTKSVSYTPTTSAQSAQVTADSGYDGLQQVNVSVGAIPSQYIIPSGTKSITANGTGIDVTQYASVDVAVPTSGSSKNVQIAAGVDRVGTTSYTEVPNQKITVAKSGTYNIYYVGFRSSTGGTNGSQLYINEIEYGSVQTTFTNHGQSIQFSNVALSADDEITVRARSRASGNYLYIGNLTIIEQ